MKCVILSNKETFKKLGMILLNENSLKNVDYHYLYEVILCRLGRKEGGGGREGGRERGSKSEVQGMFQEGGGVWFGKITFKSHYHYPYKGIGLCVCVFAFLWFGRKEGGGGTEGGRERESSVWFGCV